MGFEKVAGGRGPSPGLPCDQARPPAGECIQDILADRDRFSLQAQTDPGSLAESLLSGITTILINRPNKMRERIAGLEPQDLCQELLCRLLKDNARLLRSYDPQRASPRTWLAILISGVTKDAYRRLRRHSFRARRILPALGNSRSCKSPLDILLAEENESHLQLVLTCLDRKEREFLMALEQNDFDTQATSRFLKLNPRRVSERKSRLAARLRKKSIELQNLKS